jgi:hypothetical protein
VKRILALFLVAAAVSTIGWTASRGAAQPRDGGGAPAARARSVTEAKHDKLLSAKQVYEMLPPLERQEGGPKARFDLDDRCTWSRRWMEAARDCAASQAERVRAAEDHLGRMKRLLGVAERMQQAGDLSARDVAAIRYFADEAAQFVAEARQSNLAA